MTAIVGILNKHAIAIAADSAVTFSGPDGRKVLNRANKIFTLSKFNPVGIMIYNSASFMGVPWDIIIKTYRQYLRNKAFPKLEDYTKDFVDYLKKKKYFSDKSVHLMYLNNLVYDIVINKIGSDAVRLCGGITDENKDDVTKKIIELLDNLNKKCESLEKCEEFEKYTLDEFRLYAKELFNNVMVKLIGLDTTGNLREKIEQTIFSLITIKEDVTNFSGLVFVGYGTDEIYPSLIPVNFSSVIDNRLKYYYDIGNLTRISDDNYSAIIPFAQTDVISTILTGVDPHLEDIFATNFSKILSKYNQMLSDLIRPHNSDIADQIKNLDTNTLELSFKNFNNEIKTKEYTSPLIRAISSLDKEDLAEVAESLISLTSLKRRMTFAEESVGGPVDVAVISKCDGFIWMKRKHYFDPNLNTHFFDNYFK